MLGNAELCGDERTIIMRFFPRKCSGGNAYRTDTENAKGVSENGAIINFVSIPFLIMCSTVSDSGAWTGN